MSSFMFFFDVSYQDDGLASEAVYIARMRPILTILIHTSGSSSRVSGDGFTLTSMRLYCSTYQHTLIMQLVQIDVTAVGSLQRMNAKIVYTRLP